MIDGGRLYTETHHKIIIFTIFFSEVLSPLTPRLMSSSSQPHVNSCGFILSRSRLRIGYHCLNLPSFHLSSQCCTMHLHFVYNLFLFVNMWYIYIYIHSPSQSGINCFPFPMLSLSLSLSYIYK